MNTKNPLVLFGNKKFILGIISLAVIIGGIMLAQGPLFHDYIYGSTKPSYGGPQDPITTIWKATSPNSDLGEFNTFCGLANGLCPGVAISGSNKTLLVVSNSTHSGVALTKTSTDFSSVSGKQLYSLFTWNVVPNCCNRFKDFGIYLTTNGTLPTQAGYNPLTDNAVSLIWFSEPQSSTSYASLLELKRGETQSIQAGYSSGCSPATTCFMQVIWSNSTTQTVNGVNTEFILNFTGKTTASTFACNAVGIGNNCSTLAIDPFRHGGQSVNVTTQILPWFNFQAKSYYVGFYAQAGLGTGGGGLGPGTTPVGFTFDNGDQPSACSESSGNGQHFACMEMNLYIPSPTVSAPANIDTGGWFGPIIRALISIGVFMLANIISFGNYLGGLMGPVWAFLGGLAATVLNGLSSIIISLLNGLGSLIGDPNLGNQLVSVFTQIGSYITGLFTSIGNIVSNLITFIQNSMTFLFDSANGFLSYWIGTVLFGILGVLVTISNIIVTVLKVFQVTFPLVVLADLLWLLSESIDNGTEGAMKWWTPHEILVVNVGKLMFILVETLSTFVYQTIVEIEGGAADIKPEIAGFSP